MPIASPGSPRHRQAAPKACRNARNYAGSQFWTPDQVGGIYGVNDLFSHGMTGQGKTIGLLELAPSRPADTNHFLSCFGLHNTVTVRKIDGGATPDPFGTLEADIDIQEAAVTAPGAAIRSYEAPNNGLGEYDAYNRMVHDNVAVISTSWGRCEAALEDQAPGFIGALHVLFQQAAAQGQSIFAASGDKGSGRLLRPRDPSPDTSLQVDNPADDPFVTGVGGTSLGAPGLEPVWNDCEGEIGTNCAQTGGGATGGGQSAQFSRPSWQPVAADATCQACRGVPDISANAGVPETFYDSDFPPVRPRPRPLGRRRRHEHRRAEAGRHRRRHRLGLQRPDRRLRAEGSRTLAAKQVYGTALTDVTKGLDLSGPTAQSRHAGRQRPDAQQRGRKFKAAKGFDLSTGFGVPIARGLSCPQITTLSPRRGHGGNARDRARSRSRAGDDQVRIHTAHVISATATSATVVVPAGKGAVSVSGSDPIGSGRHHALFDYPGADTGSYRTVAADGGIFTFGGAHFYGSPAGRTTAPIVGMAVDHATGGYWLASADGNVYNFNAPYLGSTRGRT